MTIAQTSDAVPPAPQPTAGGGAEGGRPAGTNRLATESSPYLRQHAHNPVDWYPWGETAFAEAKRRQVPIFLSVGYSTCYWCHVMERECFEDAAIAKLLNESFVCVKVDREERPDVDEIYMTAVQLLTRRGGWPMSVWLTPPSADGSSRGLEPFYAGTYFPPEPRHGMPSLPQLVGNINAAWTGDRANVVKQAEQVAAAIREHNTREHAPVRVGERHIGLALSQLMGIHDSTNGGFGRAPKFPQPVFIDLLLDLAARIKDPALSSAVSGAARLTLDRMAMGGMYDQLAGGFHRYSTDEKWLVPHFEKMLYDNAMLASVYARSYAMTRNPMDAKIAKGTLDYVLREMRDAETGAFYSAQDAEVDGREGLNYVWTRAQLDEALGAQDGAIAAKIFGVDRGTNFQDPHHPEDAPVNVLFLADTPEKLAESLGMSAEVFGNAWERVRRGLLEARSKRRQPATDDKVITAWNGLMIGGLADGALATEEQAYLDAAERASKFFLVNMRTQTRGLFRTYRDTKAKTAGFLEDYAFLIQGLLKVHLANALFVRADTRYLAGAEELTEIALERFGSADAPGVLFDTRDGQADLIVRSRNASDGAMPSAQGVMLHNLMDLYLITRRDEYFEKAALLAAALSSDINDSPLNSVNSTRALLRLLVARPTALDHLPQPPEKAAAGGGTGGGAAIDTDSPVQVLAGTDRVTLPAAGAAVELKLKLTIDEGFHINAHEPGVEGMIGLTVRAEGGTGVTVETAYPTGKAYTGGALPEGEGPLLVHAGEVELTVKLSRNAEAFRGRPMLTLTYQACTDRACLAPETVSLDVAIDPG